jgi:cytochrome c553
VKGYLLAWDPVTQKEVWRANYLGPWNGGVLATAGDLYFGAYHAKTGEKLWSTFVQSPIIGAPVTYEINGEQYIAVLSGWGGIYGMVEGNDFDKSRNARNISRLLVFKLGGRAALPPLSPEPELVLNPPPATADATSVGTGEALFARFCAVCHGQGGVVPDLRTSPFIGVDAWYRIVLDGALKEGGMAPFAPVLSHDQATAIRDYVIHRAHEDEAAQGAIPKHRPDSDHGATIAAQGTPSGAMACSQCHAGGSDTRSAFPRLAGQPQSYLAEQLRDFSTGARANDIMSPIAQALSPNDIDDVAAYFAKLERAASLLASLDASLFKKGELIAETGILAKGIPACGVCHGVRGVGEPPTIPYLAGQHAEYTATQLQLWQRGSRRNSPEAMGLFAKKLDDNDIAALAAYYQQVGLPGQTTMQPR